MWETSDSLLDLSPNIKLSVKFSSLLLSEYVAKGETNISKVEALVLGQPSGERPSSELSGSSENIKS